MSHNRYLTIIGIAGVISWVAWITAVLKLDPFESTGLALAFFFLSFFLALMCTFAILGFYFRLWVNKNEIYYQHINISLRQGILLSVIANGSLAFQLLGVLTWWTGILLVAAVALIEFYFAARTEV